MKMKKCEQMKKKQVTRVYSTKMDRALEERRERERDQKLRPRGEREKTKKK